MIDLGSEVEVVQKSGSWYSYEGERLGQGRENAKQFLKENPDIRAEIANKIRDSYGLAAANYVIAGHKEDEDELDLGIDD